MSEIHNLFQDFIDDVLNNPNKHPVTVQLAVNRHLNDLMSSEIDDFPYYFNVSAANHVVKTFLGFKHTQGVDKGQPFRLQPWQAFILGSRFGWYYKTKPMLRFFTSYVEVPRKNGKSELEGGCMAYAYSMLAQGHRNEVYSIATQLQQAHKSYDSAYIILEYIAKESPYFSNIFNFKSTEIIRRDDKSIMKPLGRDRHGSLDSLNIFYCTIDEIHAHKNRSTIDVAESSTGAQGRAHISKITTAGHNKNAPCFSIRQNCIEILKGTKSDENTFTILWTVDENDDWRDPVVWEKCNPNWGVSVIPERIHGFYQKAVNEGGLAEVEFRTKHLCEWCDSAVTYISDDHVVACMSEFDIELMKNRRVYLGVDLSAVYDLTSAYMLAAPCDHDPHFRVIGHSWIPEDTLRARVHSEGADYYNYIRDGYVSTVPGNTVEYSYLRRWINDMRDAGVDIDKIVYDRWNSKDLIIDLQDDGFECVGYGQGTASISPPAKALPVLFTNYKFPERVGIKIQHDPLLRRAISKAYVVINAHDDWKFDKSQSHDRIDPLLATAMAYGYYLHINIKNPEVEIGFEVF